MFRRAAYFDITEEPLEDVLGLEPETSVSAVGLEEVPQPAAYPLLDEHDERWLANSHTDSSDDTLFGEQWVDPVDDTTEPRPSEPEPRADRGQGQGSAVDVEDVALQRELDALLQAAGPPEAPEPRVGPEALAEAERAARGADRGRGGPPRRPAAAQSAPPPVRAPAPPAPPPVDWSKRASQTPPGDLEPTPELDQHAGAEDGPAEPEVLVLELPDLPPAGTLRLQHSQAREVAPTFEDFDLDFDTDPTEQLDVAPQLAAAAPARQPGPSRARLAGCEVRRRPGALVLLALAGLAALGLAAGSLGSETIAPSSVSPADRAQGGGQLHGKRAVRPRRRASLRRRRRVPRVRQATRPRRPVPAARPPVRVAPRPVAPPPVRTPRPAPAAPSPAPAPAPAPAPRAVPKPAAPKAGPEFL